MNNINFEFHPKVYLNLGSDMRKNRKAIFSHKICFVNFDCTAKLELHQNFCSDISSYMKFRTLPLEKKLLKGLKVETNLFIEKGDNK